MVAAAVVEAALELDSTASTPASVVEGKRLCCVVVAFVVVEEEKCNVRVVAYP
jgi:hypothetical protein